MLAVYADDGNIDPLEMFHRGSRIAWIRTKGEAKPIATVFAQGRKFVEDDVPQPEAPDPYSKDKRRRVEPADYAKPAMTGKVITLDRPPETADFTSRVFDMSLKMFWVVPLLKVFRIGVYGVTGTGKSKWAADQPMAAYNILYPDRKIHIWAMYDHDPAFDDVQNTEYHSLADEGLAKKKLSPEDYPDSLHVFDDIESIVDADVLKTVMRFRDTCLTCGRKEGVSTINISHEIHDREKTKIVNNECDEIVLFNQGNGNVAPIKKLLAEKFGLSKELVEYVLDSPTRWMAVKKSYPKVIISPSTIRLVE